MAPAANVQTAVWVLVAQLLARHSTITLTLDHYTHLAISDLATALKQLPTL